ncbi:hypothetical protein KBC04_04715 [Candidatus Babeliales bacterium]|nr:hypothetical protein [Candidatus Babeliales bacterium]MBP9844122.1 hypothetical protein [Candidatus Babeliales bacterium]
MQILKYVILKINNEQNENGLYVIINKLYAFDLLYLLSYLYFEYTRRHYQFILESIEIASESLDDEVIVQGNKENIFLDLKNPNTFYIASLFDYLDFKPINVSFVEELKQNKFKYFKIQKQSFIKLLEDWNNILDIKPSYVVLYQDKNDWVGLQSFQSKEDMEQFIEDAQQIVN